jgi:putative inorganic carbon (hco3(-)) transporter
MRDLIFVGFMAGLIPLAMMRPFVGILLWSWISFMNPHREVWGFAVNQPWAMAVFLATLIGCVVAREPKRFPVNAVTVMFAVFAVHFSISTLFGLGIPADAFRKWDRAIKVVIALLLTAALLDSRQRIHALIWLMVVALGYYGVRGGMFTVATGGGYRVWGPELSMIRDNNHIGTAMLVSIPLMNYLRLQSRHQIIRWGLVAAMAFTLFAVLGTQSRGAFLAVGAATLVLWLRSKQKLVFGTLMVAAVVGAVAFMPDRWVARMESIRSFEADQSATTRLELWNVSYLLAVDRPLLGSGFRGPYSREAVDRVAPGGPARAVHSIWFEVLGEQGFLGFAIWLGLTIAGVWYTFRLTAIARRHPELAWAGDLGRMSQVSIVAYCAGGTFLSLSYWDYYWTLLIVLPAALAVAQRSLAETNARAPAAQAAGWRTRATAAGVTARERAGPA